MSSSPSPERPSATRPDPAPKPTRRTFPAEYKLRILAEYESAPEGEKGAILRRERLITRTSSTGALPVTPEP